eukprot:SAG22_NODE_10621_length_524_cov_1.171765_1_plen_42_part_01
MGQGRGACPMPAAGAGGGGGGPAWRYGLTATLVAIVLSAGLE